jgi:hypothetical protein
VCCNEGVVCTEYGRGEPGFQKHADMNVFIRLNYQLLVLRILNQGGKIFLLCHVVNLQNIRGQILWQPENMFHYE